jgi:cell division protein FtsL
MDQVNRLSQAYIQAPWRKQLQLIGIFLLGLIMVALVAGIYLDVTARAATIGRSIQEMRRNIESLRLSNADLEIRLASLTSSAEMENRALELGFTKIEPSRAVFLEIPGYVQRQPNIKAKPPGPTSSASSGLSSEYTQSLFDWLRERIFDPAAPLMEIGR